MSAEPNNQTDQNTSCPRPAPCSAYQPNEVVSVNAWWLMGKPVKCRIVECSKLFPGFYFVMPLEGNCHKRYVNAADFNTPNGKLAPPPPTKD